MSLNHSIERLDPLRIQPFHEIKRHNLAQINLFKQPIFSGITFLPSTWNSSYSSLKQGNERKPFSRNEIPNFYFERIVDSLVNTQNRDFICQSSSYSWNE
uniref:Uncharacterized protein n=1 Tax=Rhizoctonia solani TaxID=456999 RepID=N0A365_9AGAM|nr:hypothetical protein RSOL_m00700 [Rhizoctonia solani]AGK45398.1 hypothetical protein RSOL_m00700 [Rhizoctonia solani]